ncbi:MAG: hypothetical protein D6704_12890 [Nitrospirae bacterium]|nr:MAG: hypothetical protein D6704_12890 [Nitrospirota bacterium]
MYCQLKIVVATLALLVGVSFVMGKEQEALIDLTGGVVPLITIDPSQASPGGELFADGRLTTRSDLRYRISVRNQTGEPIPLGPLILVIDKIVELARGREVTEQVDIVGYDGYTSDGKPFFRIPGSGELGPYAESESVVVRIANPNFFRLAPPIVQVRGIRHSALEQLEKLKHVLQQKGVLSEEETSGLVESPALPSP